MESYDFLVIGAGSAGYAAARTAADLGKRVAVVDGARELGGLCILRGCMPSKTLLYATEVLHLARRGRRFGLRTTPASLDLKALQRWKREVIAGFAGERAGEWESGRFTLYRSHARFTTPDRLELADGTRLRAAKFFISTGSRVAVPPVPGLAETPFWTSDDVLELDEVPASVIVLGGGAVACELAQFLRRVGSRVVMLQRGDRVLKDYSPEASAVIERAFREGGIELHTGARVERIAATKTGVSVRFSGEGGPCDRRARHLFNALGREPATAGLGLESAGVELTADGHIAVDRWQRTRNRRIYAGGDATGPQGVVHQAVAQGELAARHAFGAKGLRPPAPDPGLSVVFTDPPLAKLGADESALEERGVAYLAASHPFADHGKSILMGATAGFVKILADAERGRLIGAEIVGAQADSLIHCLGVALATKATVHDLLRMPWFHPTLAEILTYPLETIAAPTGRGSNKR